MKQRIVCRNGICVDVNNLPCEEKYNDIVRLVECEEEEKLLDKNDPDRAMIRTQDFRSNK